MRLPAVLRDLGPGQAAVALEVDEPATVARLLDALAVAHPAVERRIRDERGQLRPHVNVFVGEENIRGLDGPATTLKEGDEISVVPAVSGGAPRPVR